MRLPTPVAALVGVVAAALALLASTGSSFAAPAAAATVVRARAVTSPAVVEVPALTLTGRTRDGWEVHRLADGRLPEAAVPGVGFRGEVHFVHGGRARAVRLLVPPAARRPAPLLVALHGLYQTLETAERDQRWGPLVRREGVVLAYGVGTSTSWNAGTCCGRAVVEGVDDVGYLDRVVEIAGALHPLDPARLHVTGFSNGAMMAYRYACERGARVAGVLAVAGTVAADCRPPAARAGGRTDVAVLHVHGLQDRTVPLAGLAYSRTLRTGLRPVSYAASVFGPRITARLLPRYGHGWPTSVHGRYETTRLGWAFLQAHPRR